MPESTKKKLENCTDQEDDAVKMEVQMSKPSLELRWRKNDVTHQPENNMEMHVEETKHPLYFKKNSRSEQGYYCCDNTDDHTQAKLAGEDMTVELIKRLKTVGVKEGETCTFECVLSKYIKDEYIWTLNGRPVVSDGRVQISNEKQRYKMSIKEVNLSDAGDVVFTIRNLSSKTMLFVKEKPVMVYREMQSLFVTVGEEAEFSCEVTKCNAKIKWFKDGKRIRKSRKYEFSQVVNVVKLVIHNAMIEDSGDYSCEVGGASSRAKLYVKDLGHIFCRQLRNTKAEENGVATLECETLQPALRVTWLKGVAILTPGSKYNIKQQGRVLSLNIKELGKSDSDIYTCDVGSAQSRAMLTVTERKVFFMEELEDKVCFEGDTVMFKSRICPSDYFNVRWYLDGTLMHTDHLNTIEILPGGYHTFTMSNVARKDSGIITLEAGGKRVYAFLLVKEKHPTITKPLEDCEAIDGKNMVLSCKTSKAYHILWYKDGCLIWPSSKYLARCFDNVATLTIYNVNEKDAGWYECHAGPVSTKAQVTVKKGTELDKTDNWNKPEKNWRENEYNELFSAFSVSLMISYQLNKVTKHQEQSRKLECLAQLDTTPSQPQSEAEDSTFALSCIPIKSTSGSHTQEVSHLSAPGVFLKEMMAQEEGYEHLRSSLSKQLNEPLVEYRDDSAEPEGRKGQQGGPSHSTTMVKSISSDSGVKRPQSDDYKQQELLSRSLDNFMSMIPDSTELKESGEKRKDVETVRTDCIQYSLTCKGSLIRQRSIPELLVAPTKQTSLAVHKDQHDRGIMSVSSESSSEFDQKDDGDKPYQHRPEKDWKEDGNSEFCPVLSDSIMTSYRSNQATKQEEQSRKLGCLAQLEATLSQPQSEAEDSTAALDCIPNKSTSSSYTQEVSHLSAPGVFLKEMMAQEEGYQHLRSSLSKQPNEPLVEYRDDSAETEGRKGQQGSPSHSITMVTSISSDSQRRLSDDYKQQDLLSRSLDNFMSMIPDSTQLKESGEKRKDVETVRTDCIQYSLTCKGSVMRQQSIPELLVPPTKHSSLAVPKDQHDRGIMSGSRGTCSQFDKKDDGDKPYQHRPEKDVKEDGNSELCPVVSDSIMISNKSNQETKQQEQSRTLRGLEQLDTTLSQPQSGAEDSTFSLNCIPIKSTSGSHSQEVSHLSAPGVFMKEMMAQEEGHQHLRSSLSKQLNEPLVEYRDNSAETEGRKGQQGGPSPSTTMVKSISSDSGVKRPQSDDYKQQELWSRSLDNFMSMIPDSTQLKESGEKRKDVETVRTDCIQYSLTCQGSVMVQQSIPELLVAPTKHSSLAVPKDQHDRGIMSVSSGSSSEYAKKDDGDKTYQQRPEKDWKEEGNSELRPVLSESIVTSYRSSQVTKQAEQSRKLECLEQLDTTLSQPQSEAEDSTFALSCIPIKSTSGSHTQEVSHLSAPGVFLKEMMAQEEGYQHLRSSLSKQLDEPLVEYRDDSAETEGRKGQQGGPSPSTTMVKSISSDSGVKRPQSDECKQDELWSRSLDNLMSLIPDSTELKESREERKDVETIWTDCIQYSLTCQGSVMLQQSIPELVVAPTKHSSLTVPKDQHDRGIMSVSSGSSSEFAQKDDGDKPYQHRPEKAWKDEGNSELCPVLSDSIMTSYRSNQETKQEEQSRKLECLEQLDTTLSQPQSEAKDSTSALSCIPIKSTSSSHTQEVSHLSAPGVFLKEMMAQEEGYQHLRSNLSKQLNEPLVEYRDDSAETEGRKGQRGGPSHSITMVKSISSDSGVKRPQSDDDKQQELWSKSLDNFMSMIPDSTAMKESGEERKDVEAFRTDCIQYSLTCEGSWMLQQSIPELLVAPTKHSSLAVPKDQQARGIMSGSSGSSSEFDKKDDWDKSYQHRPEKAWKEEGNSELCPVLSDSIMTSYRSNQETKQEEQSRKLECLVELDTTLSQPQSEAEDSTFTLSCIPIKSTSGSHTQEVSHLSAPGVFLKEMMAQEEGYQHLRSSLSKQLNEPLVEYRDDSAETEGRKGQRGGPSHSITMVKSISSDSGVKRPQSDDDKQQELWIKSLDNFMSMIPDSTAMKESGEERKDVEAFRTDCIQYSLTCKGSWMLQQSIPELLVAPTKHSSLAVHKDQKARGIMSGSSGSSSEFDKEDDWDKPYQHSPEKDVKEDGNSELCPVLSDSIMNSYRSEEVTKQQDQSIKLECLEQLDTTPSQPQSEAEDSTFALSCIPIKSTSSSHTQEVSHLSAPGVFLKEMMAQEEGYQHLRSSLSKQLNEPLVEYTDDSAETEDRKGQQGSPSHSITMVKSMSCDSLVKKPQSDEYKQPELWSRSLDNLMSMIPDSTELKESGEETTNVETFRTDCTQYSLACEGSVLLQPSIPELQVAPTKHSSLAVPKDQHDQAIMSVSRGSSPEFDQKDDWDKPYQHRPEKDWKEEGYSELCPVLSDSIMTSYRSNQETKQQEQSRKLECLPQLDATLSQAQSEAEDSTFALSCIPIKITSGSHTQEVSHLSAPGVILNEMMAQEEGYQHLRSSLSEQLNEPLVEYRDDSAESEGREGQRGGSSHSITMVKSISWDSGVNRPQYDEYKQQELWSRSLDNLLSMIPDSTVLQEEGSQHLRSSLSEQLNEPLVEYEDDSAETEGRHSQRGGPSHSKSISSDSGFKTPYLISMIPDSTELRESEEKSKKVVTFRTEPFIAGEDDAPENVDTNPDKSVKADVDAKIGRNNYSVAGDKAAIIEITRPLMVLPPSEETKTVTHDICAPGTLEKLEYGSNQETTQAEHTIILSSTLPVQKDLSRRNPLFTKPQLLIPRSCELSDRPKSMDISLKPLETSLEILSLDPQNKEQGHFSLPISIRISNVESKKSDKRNQLATIDEDENTGLLEIDEKRPENRKLSILGKLDSTHKISHINDFREKSAILRVSNTKPSGNLYHFGFVLNVTPPSGKSKSFWRQSGAVKSSQRKRQDIPTTLQQQQKSEDLAISTKLKESISKFSKQLITKCGNGKEKGDGSKVASPLPKGTLPGIGDASLQKRTPSEVYTLPVLKKSKATTGSDRLAAYKTYSFLSEINRGRFSVVRLCQDNQSKQIFAAKIIPYRQEQQQQVLHEYHLLKKLDHAHIVQLHAAFITPCYLVLIQELCAGRELLHNLAERDLYAEIHVVELLRQILSAVGYLHSNCIVHLDLKSDNILLTDHNLLKIVDLGSAQTFTPGQSLSVEHVKVNIALPKAPEVLEREGVGPETDIWAIGVLVFVMLSGDDPFKSELYWESDNNIRKGKIQLGRCYPGLSEGSVSFIKRTLYNKPWGRPTAADCLQIPWVNGVLHSSRHRHSIVCFSTDKLQGYLAQQDIKREKACTKMDVLLN